MMSLTCILLSSSTSIYLRLFSLISSPAIGQLRTVHIFWSNCARCLMSSPDWILTLVAPPIFWKENL